MAKPGNSRFCSMATVIAGIVLHAIVGVQSCAGEDDGIAVANEALRAIVVPAKGGRLASLTHAASKSGLIEAPSLVDTIWLPGRVSVGLGDLPFEVRQRTGNAVTLVGKPTPDPEKRPLPDSFAGLEIAKTYRLDPQSIVLVIDYELRNVGEQPLEVCLGTKVTLTTAGDALRMALPTRAGAANFPVAPGTLPLTTGGRRQAHVYDLAESWAGVLSERGGGVAVGFQPEHVSCLHVAAGRKGLDVVRTVITLAAGASFRSRAWIMPTPGMTRLRGAGREIVADVAVVPPEADGSPPLKHLEYRDRLSKGATAVFDKAGGKDLLGDDEEVEEDEDFDALVEEDVEGGPSRYRGKPIQVSLRLLSGRSRDVKVAWRMRVSPSGKWQEVASDAASLVAGQAATLIKKVSPKEKGTYVVCAEVREADTIVASFEQPIIAGTPAGFYSQSPPPKTGALYDAFKTKLWVPSMEVERFPLPLGKPLAAGPVRMLFATPHWASRGLVEIQHRLDVETDAVIGGAFYDRTGDERASPAEVMAMREFLNRPHEVIVFAVGAGDYFPIDILDEVFRQVEQEGTGLVLLSWENHLGELDAALEALKKSPAEESDTPLRLFPRAKAGWFGKGRVVVAGEPKMYVRPDWYGDSEADVQNLLQVILWAARGEPAVRVSLKGAPTRIDNRALAAKPLGIQVKNFGEQPLAGKLRLVPRRNLLRAYPFYLTGNQLAYRPQVGWERAAPPIEQPLRARPDQSAAIGLDMPLLPACQYDFDVQVLDSEGKVVHWQCIPVTVTSASQFTEVTLTSEQAGDTETFSVGGQARSAWFRADAVDAIKATCSIRDPGEAVRARLQGLDPWGRMPFDQRVALDRDGDKGTAVFTQPLHSCVHLICVLRFSLLDGDDRELAEHRILSFVNPPPSIRPVFELRGYAEVRVDNDVSDYDVRVGGEGPLTLAWHNVRKSDYGGIIPMAQKILEPGHQELKLPDTEKLADALDQPDETEEDITAEFEEKKIDPKAGWIRVPCFNNPKDREEILGSVKGTYAGLSACYPYCGFAVDEFVYSKEYDPKNTVSFFRRAFIPQRDTNICRCEHCLVSFRKYAEGLSGGDLARLNQEWGTAFKSWKEVDPPLTVTDNETPPPPERWQHILGHRDFISQQVTDLMNEVNATVKSVHPECLTGFSGLWKTGFTMGVDIYRLSKNMIYNMLYGDIDMWTDFGDSQAVRWTGYGRKYRLLQGSVGPYREINAGQTGVGFYGKWRNPMHRGDFTFHPEPLRFFNEIRTLKEAGIDRLVVGHRYRDPVALYYSPRDVYLAQLEDWFEDPARFVAGMRNCGRSYSELCHREYGTYRALLQSRGLQPFWTAYAHLEEGHFGKRFSTPKLLLLPYAQCLSARQAETLREFVRNGGILVGDIHTGFRNEHGRLLGKGQLDDVFGIQRRGDEYRVRHRVDTKEGKEAVRFGKEFGQPFALAFAAVGPGDVAATTATPLAQYLLDGKNQPAFLVNTYGKGKAIYLNFIPAGYVAVELGGEGEVSTVKKLEGKAGEYFQRCFGMILDLAGLEQPMEFVGAGRLRCTRFGEGDLTYLGVVSSRSLEALRRPYQIRVPAKKHVYSVRGREYLGHAETFTFRLDEKTRRAGDIISLLPYKVEGIAAEAPRSVRAGEALRCSVRILPAEAQKHRHVIAVRVIDPAGNDLRWYRHSVETKDGVAQVSIGLAANDPSGTWTLRLTDAASGTREEVAFNVLAP